MVIAKLLVMLNRCITALPLTMQDRWEVAKASRGSNVEFWIYLRTALHIHTRSLHSLARPSKYNSLASHTESLMTTPSIRQAMPSTAGEA